MFPGLTVNSTKRHLSIFAARAFDPATVLPSLVTSVIIWLITIVIGASVAALIFQGRLAGYSAAGLSLFLVGAVVLQAVSTLFSSDHTVVPLPQDTAAVMLAAIAANLQALASVEMPDEILLLTVLAAIALASLMAGLFFLVLGGLRLANAIHYVPYPVIGGFLAGSGWLLIQGAMGVMVDYQIGLDTIPLLLQPDRLIRWIPGLIIAIALLALFRRSSNVLILPAVALTGMVVFYGFWHIADAPNTVDVRSQWFLTSGAQGASLKAFHLADLGKLDIMLVLSQAGSMGVLAVISTLHLLLNIRGQELEVNRELDFDRELVVSGAGNILAVLFGGGITGFPSLVCSVLVDRTGSNGRLVSLATGALLAATLLGGGDAFAMYIPRSVLGGVLLFFGGSFLIEWVVESFFKLSKQDYAIVFVILLVIATVGLLWGIAVGVLASIVLFVVDYGRNRVVRQEFLGNMWNSRVDRSAAENRMLQRSTGRIMIFRLQGYIFFGTGYQFYRHVRQRVLDAETGELKFIILDFRLAYGMDISTMAEFRRLCQLADERDMQLVLANVSEPIARILRTSEFMLSSTTKPMIYDDLDHAMEWCENCLLASSRLDAVKRVTVAEQFGSHAMIRSFDIDRLAKKYLRRIEAPAGEAIAFQGEPGDSLYLIESGRVDIILSRDKDHSVRLRSMSAGAIVGEIGLYLGRNRSASIVATERVVMLELTRDSLHRMEDEDPQIAAKFHTYITCVLSHRLTDANFMIEALMD